MFNCLWVIPSIRLQFRCPTTDALLMSEISLNPLNFNSYRLGADLTPGHFLEQWLEGSLDVYEIMWRPFKGSLKCRPIELDMTALYIVWYYVLIMIHVIFQYMLYLVMALNFLCPKITGKMIVTQQKFYYLFGLLLCTKPVFNSRFTFLEFTIILSFSMKQYEYQTL